MLDSYGQQRAACRTHAVTFEKGCFMAKESSFDVVSTVDMQEVDNAFQQAKKELAQRYDLKDSGAEIALDKAKQGPHRVGALPISWPDRSSTSSAASW